MRKRAATPEREAAVADPLRAALLSVPMLADYFGVSTRHVEKMRACDQLPAAVVLPGSSKLVRYRKIDIDAFIGGLPAEAKR